MTYRIAILDDDAADLRKTENMLSAYSASHPEHKLENVCFTETGAFMEHMCRREKDGQWAFDMAVMDICLPDGNGMVCARTLRQRGYGGIIIFVSSSKEHALEAFRVDAKQYLVKPVPQERFLAVIEQSVETLERHSGFSADTLFMKGSSRRRDARRMGGKRWTENIHG